MGCGFILAAHFHMQNCKCIQYNKEPAVTVRIQRKAKPAGNIVDAVQFVGDKAIHPMIQWSDEANKPIDTDRWCLKVPGSYEQVLYVGDYILFPEDKEPQVLHEGNFLADWQLVAPSTSTPSTPSATWRAEGKPDPHGVIYDCERAKLCMGGLTDDELANGAFMNYDVRPPLQAIIEGKAFSPIAWMTAVKDRIRWLSRRLVESTDRSTKVRELIEQAIEYGQEAPLHEALRILNGEK